MAGIDGRVSGLNRDAFQALQQVKNPQKMTEAEAKSVRSAIMKDGRIDAAEKDLLQEMTHDSGKIQVSAQATADFHPADLNFTSATGEAKDRLDILANTPNLNTLWDGGSEGRRKLIDFYSISPATARRATQFVASKVNQAWQKSNLTNGYGPLRDLIGEAYGAIKDADPETNSKGRTMYYDAAKMVDQYAGDAIPDFVYNWIRPGGYI